MTAAALPDLITWVSQQFENQRHTARVLKTLAASEPPETAAFLTETADTLVADADAKRRILDLHGPYPAPQHMASGEITACSTCGSVDDSPVAWPCPTLRLLALPCAGRPGYREEWKPA